MIDEFGTPTIPPREIYGLKPFTKIQIDSIKNRKQKIGSRFSQHTFGPSIYGIVSVVSGRKRLGRQERAEEEEDKGEEEVEAEDDEEEEEEEGEDE